MPWAGPGMDMNKRVLDGTAINFWSLIFGLSYTNLCVYLQFGRRSIGGKGTVDSAFKRVHQPFLIKSLQDILLSSATTSEEQRLEIQRKLQATSMRQAAEWGMRSIHSSFPKLEDHYVYEEGESGKLS